MHMFVSTAAERDRTRQLCRERHGIDSRCSPVIFCAYTLLRSFHPFHGVTFARNRTTPEITQTTS